MWARELLYNNKKHMASSVANQYYAELTSPAPRVLTSLRELQVAPAGVVNTEQQTPAAPWAEVCQRFCGTESIAQPLLVGWSHELIVDLAVQTARAWNALRVTMPHRNIIIIYHVTKSFLSRWPASATVLIFIR